MMDTILLAVLLPVLLIVMILLVIYCVVEWKKYKKLSKQSKTFELTNNNKNINIVKKQNIELCKKQKTTNKIIKKHKPATNVLNFENKKIIIKPEQKNKQLKRRYTKTTRNFTKTQFTNSLIKSGFIKNSKHYIQTSSVDDPSNEEGCFKVFDVGVNSSEIKNVGYSYYDPIYRPRQKSNEELQRQRIIQSINQNRVKDPSLRNSYKCEEIINTKIKNNNYQKTLDELVSLGIALDKSKFDVIYRVVEFVINHRRYRVIKIIFLNSLNNNYFKKIKNNKNKAYHAYTHKNHSNEEYEEDEEESDIWINKEIRLFSQNYDTSPPFKFYKICKIFHIDIETLKNYISKNIELTNFHESQNINFSEWTFHPTEIDSMSHLYKKDNNYCLNSFNNLMLNFPKENRIYEVVFMWIFFRLSKNNNIVPEILFNSFLSWVYKSIKKFIGNPSIREFKQHFFNAYTYLWIKDIVVLIKSKDSEKYFYILKKTIWNKIVFKKEEIIIKLENLILNFLKNNQNNN